MTTYQNSIWDLSDLYPGIKTEPVDATLQQVEKDTTKFETFREQLSPEMDIEDFYEAITLTEKIYLQIGKLAQYAFLRFSANTQDSEATTFMGKIDQLAADVENKMLFFSLWWKGLSDEEAQKFMVRAGQYEYFLQKLRNFKPYTLSEPEEKNPQHQECHRLFRPQQHLRGNHQPPDLLPHPGWGNQRNDPGRTGTEFL